MRCSTTASATLLTLQPLLLTYTAYGLDCTEFGLAAQGNNIFEGWWKCLGTGSWSSYGHVARIEPVLQHPFSHIFIFWDLGAGFRMRISC